MRWAHCCCLWGSKVKRARRSLWGSKVKKNPCRFQEQEEQEEDDKGGGGGGSGEVVGVVGIALPTIP